MPSRSIDDFCHLPRDLAPGSIGADVHCLQRLLVREKFLKRDARADGRYDANTRDAVKAWATANKWANVSGGVDSAMRRAYGEVRDGRDTMTNDRPTDRLDRRLTRRRTRAREIGERLRDDVERTVGERLREWEKCRWVGVRGRVRGTRGDDAVLSDEVRDARRR